MVDLSQPGMKESPVSVRHDVLSQVVTTLVQIPLAYPNQSRPDRASPS